MHSPQGFDDRDSLARVSVCVCLYSVRMWVHNSDCRVCLCVSVCILGNENCWNCRAKKTTTGEHVGRCSTKTEIHRARVAAETGSDGDSRWQNRKRDLRKGGRHNDSDGEAHIQKKTEAAGSAFQSCSN